MHIPDGFLSGNLNIVTYAASIGACGYAIKKVKQMGEMRIPLLGLSVVFLLVVQALNLPLDETASAHFVGAVLLASLLGPWATCLVMAIVLVIQRLVFGYGGLASMGTNLFNLGVLGGIGGYYLLMGLKKVFPHSRNGFLLALFVSTWASVMIITVSWVVESSLSGMSGINLLRLLGMQSLIGAGEAAVTVGLVSLIIGARPDLVVTYCCGGDKDTCYAHHHHVKTHTHEAGKEHDHGHIY
jgi:cobalt/nickel transport system permease protein